jgi:hypothetical protein
MDPVDLAVVTCETFEPLVGDTFSVALEPSPLELVLRAATAAGDWPGGRQPFRLEFTGPAEPQLPQAIYRLEHATLGALEIFIVPVGRDAASTRYEAIFT